MVEVTLHIGCCFCPESTKHTVELPDGWEHRYGAVDDEHDGFCPKHAKVFEFAQSQCPGCVGGWGDCDMWRAFAEHGSRRVVNERDFESLRKGVCPRRVNGTFSFDQRSGVIEDITLSEKADDEAGAAFADAIKEYCERYNG